MIGHTRQRSMPLVLAVIGALLAAPSGVDGAGDWWHPGTGLTWEIQISSTPKSFKDVQAYDVDLDETPKQVIDELRARNINVICYFSAGSYENWRDDADSLKPYRGNKLGNWPGEWWIDIRKPAVRQVMTDRLDVARDKGCDAVDPDNVDAYANRSGFPLTQDDQLDYLRFLSREVHSRGMAVGLKNAVELIPQVVADFDFTVNEECFDYDECDALAPFVEAGKPVLQIQYGGSKQAKRICPQAYERTFSTLVKKLNLDQRGISCQRDHAPRVQAHRPVGS